MQQKRRAKPYAALLAVLMCLHLLALAGTAGAAEGGYVASADGRTANYDYEDGAFDAPLVIRKTVATQSTGPRDFQLTLTANGYDWTTVPRQDIYAIFVIDTTSSMGFGVEVKENPAPSDKRITATKAAAQSYIDAFFASAGGAQAGSANVNKHVAIVSYGANARVHVPADYAAAGAGLIKNVSDDSEKWGGEGSDHFFGSALRLSKRTDYAGYNSAVAAAKQDLRDFKAAFDGDTSPLFMSDAATAKTVVENVSKYSDTNIESGLLMAEYIIDNLGAEPGDPIYVFLITDGEANSSSSLIEYEHNPALLGWLDSRFEEANGLLSYSSVMAQVTQLANDSAFAGSITDIDHTEVNFFRGNFHNLDRHRYLSVDGDVQLTHTEFVRRIGASALASQGADSLSDYYDKIDAAARAYAGDDGDKIAQYNELLREYAKLMLLIAQQRTDFYRTTPGDMKSEAIFGAYDEGSKAFDFFPFADTGKNDALLMYDYREHTSSAVNATGSDSAKLLMQQAADLLNRRKNVTLYATGIGSDIVMADKLAKVTAIGTVDDNPTFLLCNSQGAIVKNAQQLSAHFAALGYRTGMAAVADLTISDYIPRRAAGVGDIDDDTFTVPDATAVSAVLHYYNDQGNRATVAVPLVEGDNFTFNPAATYRGQPAYHISWNAGSVYSEGVAKAHHSADYPCQVELRINLTANPGVLSAAPRQIDIDTNLHAQVDWVDGEGPKDMEYPIPKVCFEPPTTSGPENPVPGTSETTSETEETTTEAEETTTEAPETTAPETTAPPWREPELRDEDDPLSPGVIDGPNDPNAAEYEEEIIDEIIPLSDLPGGQAMLEELLDDDVPLGSIESLPATSGWGMVPLCALGLLMIAAGLSMGGGYQGKHVARRSRRQAGN